MKTIANAMVCFCFAMAAGGVAAQDAPGNGVPQPRQGNMKAVQACKDRMAKSDAMKSDDPASMKMDKKCARLLKKQEMKDAAAKPK